MRSTHGSTHSPNFKATPTVKSSHLLYTGTQLDWFHAVENCGRGRRPSVGAVTLRVAMMTSETVLGEEDAVVSGSIDVHVYYHRIVVSIQATAAWNWKHKTENQIEIIELQLTVQME